MTAQTLNRVTLIGHLESDPLTIGKGTSHELVIFTVVTRDTYCDSDGELNIKHRRHKVVVRDYAAKEYIHMFLHKGDCVFVEGQLEYVRNSLGNNSNSITTEIAIMPSQGYLRRLGETPVTELEEGPEMAACCNDI